MGLLRLRARRGSNGRLPLPLLAAAAVVVVIAALVGGAAAQGSTPSGPGPNYFDPKNFNPSMAVVIVVLVTAFFFLGFFSIYIRRCSGGPLGGGGPPGEYGGAGRFMFASAAMARSTRRARGLDRAVLESFPTVAYADVKAHKGGGGGGGVVLECAVCISEFDDDEILRLLPRCSHAFHVDCIDAWLASHVTCPVCRSNLSVVDAPPPPPPVTTTATAAPEQVIAVVDAEAGEREEEEERIRREEAAELMRIGSVKRALRSKSGHRPPPPPPAAQFPRSHTTGHSLAAASASADERYTLRLPDHVLREAVAAARLRRTTSAGGGGAAAGRSVRLGRSGRWSNVSLLMRTLSARLPAWGSSVRRGEADAAPAKGGDGAVAVDGGDHA